MGPEEEGVRGELEIRYDDHTFQPGADEGHCAMANDDLMALTGAPATPLDYASLTAYAFNNEASRHVVYVTADGRLIELFRVGRDPWGVSCGRRAKRLRLRG